MNVSQTTVRRLVSKTGWPTNESVCPSCRLNISRRHYAQAAAAVAEYPSSKSSTNLPAEGTSLRQAYQLRAGVILSRPPQITRDLHPFEKSFFLYQRRLNERLALPFTKYLYYKQDTPADIDEKRKRKTRLTFAHDIGVYKGYGKEAWNDELLLDAPESEPEHQLEALLQDAEPPAIEEGSGAVPTEPVERPPSRVTKADVENDQKSLNRLLQRTLYLLVKDQSGNWILPEANLIGQERLHKAAERVIVQTAGLNMNTWVIGNVPAGHVGRTFTKGPVVKDGVEELGYKTFFMKARIMAGQANLQENKFGLQDFLWLAKEEVQPLVHPSYWKSVRDMFAER